MLLEQLHDQCSPLVQGASQGGVGHLFKLQLSQDVLSVRAWRRETQMGTCMSAGFIILVNYLVIQLEYFPQVS